MNKTDQQRNQASLDLLAKMSNWIDEQMEIDEELERLEREWRDKQCITPTTTDEVEDDE